jgi:hypothetical protein
LCTTNEYNRHFHSYLKRTNVPIFRVYPMQLRMFKRYLQQNSTLLLRQWKLEYDACLSEVYRICAGNNPILSEWYSNCNQNQRMCLQQIRMHLIMYIRQKATTTNMIEMDTMDDIHDMDKDKHKQGKDLRAMDIDKHKQGIDLRAMDKDKHKQGKDLRAMDIDKHNWGKDLRAMDDEKLQGGLYHNACYFDNYFQMANFIFAPVSSTITNFNIENAAGNIDCDNGVDTNTTTRKHLIQSVISSNYIEQRQHAHEEEDVEMKTLSSIADMLSDHDVNRIPNEYAIRFMHNIQPSSPHHKRQRRQPTQKMNGPITSHIMPSNRLMSVKQEMLRSLRNAHPKYCSKTVDLIERIYMSTLCETIDSMCDQLIPHDAQQSKLVQSHFRFNNM